MSRFLFPRSRWYARAEKLSGGERRRLQLLAVLAARPNFLLLDEPTNDLDMDTMLVVEDWVQTFGGVLLVVSHDRWFLDRTCEKLFLLPADGSGKVRVWEGRFSDYLEWQDADDAAAAEAAAAAEQAAAAAEASGPPPPPPPPEGVAAAEQRARPLSAFEVKELSRLEGEIDALELQRAALRSRIDGFDSSKNGFSELSEWDAELQLASEKVEKAEDRWLALSERADL